MGHYYMVGNFKPYLVSTMNSIWQCRINFCSCDPSRASQCLMTRFEWMGQNTCLGTNLYSIWTRIVVALLFVLYASRHSSKAYRSQVHYYHSRSWLREMAKHFSRGSFRWSYRANAQCFVAGPDGSAGFYSFFFRICSSSTNFENPS